MGKPNPQNLNPCNSENARERQLKSAEKSNKPICRICLSEEYEKANPLIKIRRKKKRE